MITVANFEKFLISCHSFQILEKVTKVERVSSKALRIMDKKPVGGLLDRIGISISMVTFRILIVYNEQGFF